MAAKIVVAGDDFIDMEVSSYFSSSQSREFEFQMSSSMNNVEDKMRSEGMLASPADELFYKGKLLPLHLPPRLQMVEKLLQNSPLPDFDHKNQTFHHHEFDREDDELMFSTPLATTTKPTPTTTTCNTPFESCQVSRELNPEEYIFEFDDFDERKNNNNNNKKSWAKKLMIMKKPSIVGSTLKASRAYLRSLFGKSTGGGGCSCETYYAVSTTKVADESSASKGFNNSKNTKSLGNNKKVPFGQIQRTNNKEKRTTSTEDHGNGSNNNNRHRRSFSVGLKLMQSSGNNKSSSSSSSFLVANKSSSSSISRHHQNLKRCCSTNSDRENSIQGAIAHCKKSHQISTESDDYDDDNGATTNLFSSSARSVCDDHQQRHEICCRG